MIRVEEGVRKAAMVYIRSARTYMSKIKDVMYINAKRVSRINRSTYNR